jgi:hypothetical protein
MKNLEKKISNIAGTTFVNLKNTLIERNRNLNGIYHDKIKNKVYFVNFEENGIADLSTVLVHNNGGMYKILNDHIKIYSHLVERFYFCGDYTRDMIYPAD